VRAGGSFGKYSPDQLELVEIGGIDEVDVCLEHALKRASALGENGFELL
jgi:hypothetical protein